MLFYCCNSSITAGIQFYCWKCSFITGNAVLLLEMQFHCWKYSFTTGMQFYYNFIAENAVLLLKINFCLKNCDFIIKIN
jgi:hypothetical protein